MRLEYKYRYNFLNYNSILLNLFNDFKKDKIDTANKHIILHMLGPSPDLANFDYRRFKLFKYLNMNKNSDTVIIPIFTEDIRYLRQKSINIIKQAEICIISNPNILYPLLVLLNPDCKIYYDKTDYWKCDDSEAIEKADKIICSSKFIYDELPEFAKLKANVVINGSTRSEIIHCNNKFDKLSAVYAGIYLNKVDLKYLYNFIKNNSGIDVYLFCCNNKNLDEEAMEYYDLITTLPNVIINDVIDYNDLLKFLSRCHVGLLPLRNDNKWTKGMFSLKIFDYLIADIPCYYINSDNYNDFDGICCFNGDKYDIKEVVSLWNKSNIDKNKILKDNLWENKFKEIVNIFGLKGYLKS